MTLSAFNGTFRLLVLGGAMLAASRATPAMVDFEDLTPTTTYTGMGGGHYWKGPAVNATDEPDPYGGAQPVKVGTFESGGISFRNSYNTNYDSWSGFAYSNTSDTTTAGYTNQFSAYTGAGFGGGGNYGIAYGYLDGLDLDDPDFATDVQGLPWLELPAGAVIQGAYVTNTTYAVLSMLNGDGFAKKFGGTSGNDPDWFKLIVYGSDALGVPLSDSVEFYLADYRFADNARDYIVDEWMLLDLSPLAGATRLHFNVASSDVGTWGMNTPSYFAMDNISYSVIPEPAAAIMLGIGAACAIGLPRRRRRYPTRHSRTIS